MIFQLFFECSDIPDSMMDNQVLNIPCLVLRGGNRISVLLNYDELNAYMMAHLGLGSADLTHIVMGDEKNVL